jgi:hypothetical protein
MAGKTLLLAALVTGALTTGAAAATVTVTRVDRSRPGWMRIALRYAAKGTPAFRLTPICRSSLHAERLVASVVHLLPARRQAAIDVRDDDLGSLAGRRPACRVAGLAVEMLQGENVVASTEIPLTLPAPPALVVLPPPAPARASSRFGVVGRKYAAPQTKMSEAGVTLALTDRLSLHLSYERTAFAPTMSRDHDDGILTGLKVGF